MGRKAHQRSCMILEKLRALYQVALHTEYLFVSDANNIVLAFVMLYTHGAVCPPPLGLGLLRLPGSFTAPQPTPPSL